MVKPENSPGQFLFHAGEEGRVKVIPVPGDSRVSGPGQPDDPDSGTKELRSSGRIREDSRAAAMENIASAADG